MYLQKYLKSLQCLLGDHQTKVLADINQTTDSGVENQNKVLPAFESIGPMIFIFFLIVTLYLII